MGAWMESLGMKRTVVAVVLAAACLGAGVAVWRWSRERQVSAAQLAPAETLLLADFPDLPATAMRWKETALYALLHEPQVQAFLAKPLVGLQQNDVVAGAMTSRQRHALWAVSHSAATRRRWRKSS